MRGQKAGRLAGNSGQMHGHIVGASCMNEAEEKASFGPEGQRVALGRATAQQRAIELNRPSKDQH